MRIFAPLFVTVVVQSCNSADRVPGGGTYERTPAGHKVFIRADRGSFSSGLLTKAQVYNWLDDRIAAWIVQRAGQFGVERINDIAKNSEFLLFDDFVIETSASPTGFASGLNSGYFNALAIWHFRVVDKREEVPVVTPSWLIKQSPTTGRWAYGLIPEGEIGLPATGHELDHTLGIPHAD